jgi:hypothetical protein
MDQAIARATGATPSTIPPQNSTAGRAWSILLTSENHGTVGPIGCTFPWAGEKHERVQVVEVVAAGAAPAPGVDMAGLVRLDVAATNTAGAVPEGWAIAPSKPTREMVAAGLRTWANISGSAIEEVYAAMLAAAPSAPALAEPAPVGQVKVGDVPRIEITLRQAKELVECFGGHDAEVSVIRRPAAWADMPDGLYAYFSEYPNEGSMYLGPTEVDDELAMNGEPAQAAKEVPSIDTQAAFLLPGDMEALARFCECAEDFDSGGHDVPKEAMRRLVEIGVVRPAGPGRHMTTSFGDHVMGRDAALGLELPLKTLDERNQKLALRSNQEKGGAQ